MRNKFYSYVFSFRFVIVIFVTFLGAIWVANSKPALIIQGTDVSDKIVPSSYMIVAFPVLGFLVANLVQDLRIRKINNAVEGVLLIGALLIISTARLALYIPVSGHVLLCSVYIFKGLLLSKHERHWSILEMVFVGVVLIVVSYVKIFIWRDILGFAMGLVFALILLGMLYLARTMTHEIRKRLQEVGKR